MAHTDEFAPESFSLACMKAVDINRVLADMEPLMRRTRLLSLNAEIASAHIGESGKPFGVVVKELLVMTSTLGDLIREVDDINQALVNSIARGINAYRKMGLFQKSVDRHETASALNADDGGKQPRAWGNPLNPGLGARWAGEAASMKEDSPGKKLLEKAAGNRAQILLTLSGLEKICLGLERLIEKVNLVARRQSRFVAIIAMVESARLGDMGKNLSTVAENIKQLAGDIDTVGNNASHRIAALIAMTETLLNPVRDEASAARGIHAT